MAGGAIKRKESCLPFGNLVANFRLGAMISALASTAGGTFHKYMYINR